MLEAAVFCLALTVYHEARSEPAVGQAAVAMVVLNRADWRPERVCPVVFAPSQFSYANDKVRRTKQGWALHWSLRPKEQGAWAFAQAVAREALRMSPEKDITRGATHYHTPQVNPGWAMSFRKLGQIGSHRFYRPGVVSQR